MAQQSKIQWTDATWNPWHGCKKVSPGCKFCYMYRDKERYGQEPTTVLRSKSTFNDPLKWVKEVRQPVSMFNYQEPAPRPDDTPFHGMKIFTCSWSDFFIEEADAWRPEAWKIIKDTPEFTYQILTKRPERIAQCLPDDWGQGYENVWLGVSVEANDCLHRLETLGCTPAHTRFACFEPLIGLVRFLPRYADFIDWAIIGGESGNETGKYKYRRCYMDWIEFLVSDLAFSGVPVFVKQLGTYLSKEMSLKDRHGGDWSEWPEWLKIREFPEKITIALALRAADDDELQRAGLKKIADGR